jgi:hypothetical protein
MDVKKILILSLSTIAITFLTSSSLFAQTDNCIKSEVTIGNGLALLVANPENPIKDDDGYYIWQYHIESSLNINQSFFAIPYDCSNPIIIQPKNGHIIYAPGEGAGTNSGNFGQGIFTVQTYQVSSNADYWNIEFKTDKPEKGAVSFALKSKAMYYSNAPIIGPGYTYAPEYFPEYIAEEFEWDGIKLIIRRDNNGCIKKVLKNGEEILGVKDSTYRYIGKPGQLCPEAWLDVNPKTICSGGICYTVSY